MSNKKLPSYPSVYTLGHKAVVDLFDSDVVVQEKCDGSQFSFALIDDELIARSKGKDQTPPVTDKMFLPAIETVEAIKSNLRPGWVYRGEYLSKPKHNALTYERVPQRHVVLFDVDRGLEDYLSYGELCKEAERLGLEVVPLLAEFGPGEVKSWDMLKQFLTYESFLGGPKVEGIVIKAYGRFGPDKKTLMAKYVSEAFKEVHDKEWKAANPSGKDALSTLVERLRTEARWQKAVQHLKENGQLQGTPQDIGPLLKEVQQDILKEERERIQEALFNWAWQRISRGVVAGLPEWYKERLAESQFEEE